MDSSISAIEASVRAMHFFDSNFGFAKSFYSDIGSFLLDDSKILWSSGMPLSREFFRVPGTDKIDRGTPPIVFLYDIITAGGLLVREVIHPENAFWSFWLIVSEKPKAALEELFYW